MIEYNEIKKDLDLLVKKVKLLSDPNFNDTKHSTWWERINEKLQKVQNYLDEYNNDNKF